MVKSAFTDPYRELISALRSARKGARLTQQELAERLGKPQSFVSKYENAERRLDVVEFVEVATLLRVDPCELITAHVIVPGRRIKK